MEWVIPILAIVGLACIIWANIWYYRERGALKTPAEREAFDQRQDEEMRIL
jgi:hypothetical protein